MTFLKLSVYTILMSHSILTSHIPSAEWPHVANGYHSQVHKITFTSRGSHLSELTPTC